MWSWRKGRMPLREKAIEIRGSFVWKVFSMTGVNHANMLIKSAGLRERYLKQRTADHFGSIDPFFYAALTAGYSIEGWDRVQERKAQVWGNYQYIRQVLEHQIPEIRVSPLEGTYVAWMDFRKLRLSEKELQEFLVNKVNVLGDPGNEYGPLCTDPCCKCS